MARRGGIDLGTVLIIGGGLGVAAYFGLLGADAQRFVRGLLSGGTTQSSTSSGQITLSPTMETTTLPPMATLAPGPVASGGCDPYVKSEWVKALSPIGVTTCIADAYCAEFGQLPNSLPELIDWATRRGFYNPVTGTWRCP